MLNVVSKYLSWGMLIVGFILGAGFQQVRIAELKAEHSKTLADIAEKTTAAYKELKKYQDQVDSQLTGLRNENHKHMQELSDMSKAAATARTNWMRQLASLKSTNNQQANQIRSLSESISDQATFDMFIELLDRNSRAVLELAEYADRLKAAGLMCEKISDVYSDPQAVKIN